MPPKRPLRVQVRQVTNQLDALLKLLKADTSEERWEAIEALTGITSRAIVEVVGTQLQGAAQSLKSVNATLKTLKKNAKGLAG
jgi:hypothetical protein